MAIDKLLAVTRETKLTLSIALNPKSKLTLECGTNPNNRNTRAYLSIHHRHSQQGEKLNVVGLESWANNYCHAFME